jgi:uncharacterized protein
VTEAAGESTTKRAVQIRWGVKIPMRDGIRLNATLYLPKESQAPRPTIFTFTPYIADAYHDVGVSLAENGYPYLAIDVRGRGNSEGEFVPFFNESKDGHDIVEWVAKQPYCNGKVATCGISYVGYDQWAMVRESPPHLATIVPSAPCWVGLDYPLRHNIFYSFLARWLLVTWGHAQQATTFADEKYWTAEYLRFFESGLPFKKLDEFYGFSSKVFREWVEHPHQDAYYDRANPTAEQLATLPFPVLSLTGIYDGDQPGTIEFYREHLKHAGEAAQHYLVIGPWDHPGVRNPQAEFMGIKCGPASLVDMKKLHREWFAATMEESPRPEFLKKKVAHYVMVAEKWRYADTLDEVTARFETLHLQSVSNPNNLFQSGRLATEPAKRAEPDHYVYDPRDLTIPKLESSLTITGAGINDQRLVFAMAGRHLVYHTAPFEDDTEVSGFFKLTVWLAIDQPDTDFAAAIYDIGPEGSSLLMTSQHFRARYRDGLRIEKLIDTTEPLRYDFDRFFFVSRTLQKDHRLRLVIGPNHTLHWQKNYNSGKPNAEECMQDARTVTVKLFHDAAHPSVLLVPIGRPEESDAD